MPSGDSLYYWDACIFIAWLKDEKREDRGDMDGILHVLEKLEEGGVRIITSVMTLSEVLDTHLPEGVYDNFEKTLRRRCFSMIAHDQKVARLSGELRNYYASHPDEYGGKNLSSPDSIHLATAILHNVDEFHTFDRKNSRGTLGLLPLDGNVAGHPLRICKPPRSKQMSMVF